jgi:glycosyltransferase involved in cell wall biosynthesis
MVRGKQGRDLSTLATIGATTETHWDYHRGTPEFPLRRARGEGEAAVEKHEIRVEGSLAPPDHQISDGPHTPATSAVKKIAIVAPLFPPSTGGQQEYAAQIALGLHRRGHEVVVFTLKGNIGRAEGYEVRDVLQGRHSSDRKIIQELVHFDVIHVTNAASSWVSTCAKPVFLSVHGNEFIRPDPVYGYDLKARLGLPKGDRVDFWLASWRTRVMMRRCLALVRRIFAVSEYTKSAFLRRYPHCRRRVISAGLGVSSFFLDAPLSSRKEVSCIRLLTVCRLSEPRKNVDLVLRALAHLKSDYAFRYTVVGEGYLRSNLTALSVELGIADRVTFAGKVDNMRSTKMPIYLLCRREPPRTQLRASELFILRRMPWVFQTWPFAPAGLRRLSGRGELASSSKKPVLHQLKTDCDRFSRAKERSALKTVGNSLPSSNGIE